MNPNDPRIVSAYGDLMVLTGKAEDGTDLLIKAYELDPVGLGNSNADKRLGDVMFGSYVKGDYQQCLEYDKKIGRKQPIAWAAKIASLESLNQSQEKESELKKFAEKLPRAGAWGGNRQVALSGHNCQTNYEGFGLVIEFCFPSI